MSLEEINFDGIVGPSHNYAGLSPGNLAAAANAGAASHPRAAALQGIAKMRTCLALGQRQGVFFPHARPDEAWLARLGTSYEAAEPHLRAQALSASAMWAANAATVSPAPDAADGRCHLTVANLVTMPHRSHEWPGTLAQLRVAFAHPAFAVHPPVPPPFGDEGAANHLRLAPAHDAAGVEVFVYGEAGGPYPARQSVHASEAVARLHGLNPARTLFAAQSAAAIAAGAFHNDVVAVANGPVLLAHQDAFADPDGLYAALRRLVPGFHPIEVPRDRVSLADAVSSYLFNAQLVGRAEDGMTLVLPGEARAHAGVRAWAEELVAGNGPVRRLAVVDVRESMANGGGPACLRLRVVADPATVDPRFLADEAGLDRLAAVVEEHWPERIDRDGIGDPELIARIGRARGAMLRATGLEEVL